MKRMPKKEFLDGIYIPPSLRQPDRREALLEYVEEQKIYQRAKEKEDGKEKNTNL